MKHVIKINAFGGIFTPIKLKNIVDLAAKYGAKNINFGPRQEIFFNITKEYLAKFTSEFSTFNIDFEVDNDVFPNLISSYPSEGIFSGDYWLSEGIYKDIFDLFEQKPKLKINICDDDQCLVPFFTGEINFVSSKTYHYWYLFLNFKENEKPIRWNRLIYSTDIPKICAEIEELYLNNGIRDFDLLMRLVNENTSFLFNEVGEELQLPRFVFPYYEGMNKYGNKFWLGIYRRDYLFPIAFIKELCMLCVQTNIAQICLTPWRSVIIKGIEQKDRIQWEKLLGKHQINLRHSSNELNWLVEDINSSEIELKKHIISAFDSNDVRTFGLVFGIKLQNTNYIPTSIIIEEKPFLQKDDLRLLSSFDIYFTENFNPNNPNRILFARNIRKQAIVNKLLELCRKYYSDLDEKIPILKIEEVKKNNVQENVHIDLYRCKHCFTIYDQRFGDELNNVIPDTPFLSIAADYKCPTCDSLKEDYEKVENIFEIN